MHTHWRRRAQPHRSCAGGGTVVEQALAPPPSPAKAAPFAVSPLAMAAAGQAGRQATDSGSTSNTDSEAVMPGDSPTAPHRAPLHLAEGLERAAQDSLPLLIERLGIELAGQELQLTSVPDLVFAVWAGGEEWTVQYNALAGSVSAQPTAAQPQPAISWRRILTRMHVAHGYAGQDGARWIWAVLVDIMAFVMVFWGLSGIAMWWQLKRIRPWGTVALCVSLTLALLLGMGMLESIR